MNNYNRLRLNTFLLQAIDFKNFKCYHHSYGHRQMKRSVHGGKCALHRPCNVIHDYDNGNFLP